jgi:ribosome recycling factor
MATVNIPQEVEDLKRRMQGALATLKTEFQGLRTGRASASLVEPVMVEAYGSHMALKELASVSVPESRLITVQVWDKSVVSAVDKALRGSGLGINPVLEGQLFRIPIPELNQERRTELSKVASRYAEQAKVAVRNVRRDGMDRLKKHEKDGHVGEDEHRSWSEKIQAATDDAIRQIDASLTAKEKEIMQV